MEDSKTTNSEALEISDAKLEMVKNNTGTGSVQRARARNGKFVATATVSAQQDAKDSQKFMAATDFNTGMSRKESLREALYEAALHPTEKSLGSAVKVIQFFEEESGHTKIKSEMLSDKSHITPVLKIIINSPEGIGMMEERGPELTQPSWVRNGSEPKPYIDAEFTTSDYIPKPTAQVAPVPNVLEERRADAIKRGPQR
jgi:hypothetical protein